MNPNLTATLNVSLSDTLSAEDLAELSAMSVEEDKPLSKLMFEGAKEVIRRRREQRSGPGNGGSHPEMAA